MLTEELKKLSLPERHELARKQIAELLSHYQDGWDIFKNPDDNDWDIPAILKPEWEETLEKDFPKTWIGVVEKVGEIIAKTKYGLDTYENALEIINQEQMVDAYAHVGLPWMYRHWSHGLQMIQQQKLLDKNKAGLAYELVINSNPCISFCMVENRKHMQMLVILHAAFGHNSFFKNNYMFKKFTDADTILDQVHGLKKAVERYAEKYGYDEMNTVLDAAHVLRNCAFSRTVAPPPRTLKEEIARRKRIDEANRLDYDDLMERTTRKGKTVDTFAGAANPTMGDGEENVLRYIARNAPNMDPDKRDLLNRFCDVQQYFYPQMQTQVMNEGWATFWHHTLINDFFDMGLVDDKIMMEFIDSHAMVVYQPDSDSKHYSGINPYAFGFAIYKEIKRICEEPTGEDYEFFPDIAGTKDWLKAIHYAMETKKDEFFISQYLSPKLMREWRLYAVNDDPKEKELVVSSIHNDQGYIRLRQELSTNYNLAEKLPYVEVGDNDRRNSRTLTLQHLMYRGRPLSGDAQDVVHHAHVLWEFPVVLQSIETDGSIQKTYAFPPGSRPPEKMLKPRVA